jgi:hypothetical protein
MESKMSMIHNRPGTILASRNDEKGTAVIYTLTHAAHKGYGSISRRAKTADHFPTDEVRYLRTENDAVVEVIFTKVKGRFLCVAPDQALAALKGVIASVTKALEDANSKP